jgi:4-amino-4-deoxy-L-arabinose transferase-like glycosyltransferase
VAALAALSYSWGISHAVIEPFYGAAARSMSQSWHNFFFGAFDPWGTVSVDKLPGALWPQALALRTFGFHLWAIVLPQIVEGTLTVLVLYRTVRQVAGAGAGLVAAVVLATSPVTILLNRGNISDTLLILLLVLAADATQRACATGRVRPLAWAGVLVGLAFQTKMTQAWLVLPALFLAYLIAAPAASFLRRTAHVALSTVIVVVVSLSWMTAVSAVPAHDRPYADGSCNNSVFTQVFSYNGFDRFGLFVLDEPGCTPRSGYLIAAGERSVADGDSLAGIHARWDRLLTGPFGRDDGWLLPAALVSTAGLFFSTRRRRRTDGRRAATVLWVTWLVLTFGLFSGGRYLNSYYLAALVPAIAALCGMGFAAAWQRRESLVVRATVAVTVGLSVVYALTLVPASVGVRGWIIASTLLVGGLAVGILLASLTAAHASVWSRSVGLSLAAGAVLLGAAWPAGIAVVAELGPFSAPYQSPAVNRYTQSEATLLYTYAALVLPLTEATPPRVAVDTFETSAAASVAILTTGREFLPVGGFSGEVPAPSRPQFIALVAAGRIHRVTLATAPLTRNPDLRWVRVHCTYRVSYYERVYRATFGVYDCSPADAGN